MEHEIIRSGQNPRIKNLVRLREGNHRRRQRRFIIEGRREIERALTAGIALDELYYCPELFRQPADSEWIGFCAGAGAQLCRLSPEAFEKCAFRENPDGLLAVAPQWEQKLEDLRLGNPALLLVVERVEKPGNLGTLLRNAECAGADAVIVTDPVTDIFNPNVVRSSQGALFSVPIAVSDNLTTRTWLSRHGIFPLATTPDSVHTFWEPDFRRPTALLLGSEMDGLSPFWLDAEVPTARIPMAGIGDSLNVSAAAAIFLFEAVRQRSVEGIR